MLVEDEAIRTAQDRLWNAVRLVVEPAGVVGIAALMSGAYAPVPGEHVAVVISGANTTPATAGR